MSTIIGAGALLPTYDLYICSGGFEERALAAIKSLPKRTRIDHALIHIYTINDLDLKRRNILHAKDIQAYLSSIGTKDIQVTKGNPSKVEGFYERVRELVQSARTILIDVTSFTRLFLYALLRAVSQHEAIVHILYSEPYDYTMNYSRGLERIIIDPFFSGIPDQSKKVLMVMFVGWEIRRAESVIEEFDPDRLITIIEKSNDPRRKMWNATTQNMCKNLIDMAWSHHEITALRPTETYLVLEKLYQKLHLEYDFCILNIGPKLHCLGIYEFVSKHEDVQLLYPKPYVWNQNISYDSTPAVSLGEGRTYLFEMNVSKNLQIAFNHGNY